MHAGDQCGTQLTLTLSGGSGNNGRQLVQTTGASAEEADAQAEVQDEVARLVADTLGYPVTKVLVTATRSSPEDDWQVCCLRRREQASAGCPM